MKQTIGDVIKNNKKKIIKWTAIVAGAVTGIVVGGYFLLRSGDTTMIEEITDVVTDGASTLFEVTTNAAETVVEAIV